MSTKLSLSGNAELLQKMSSYFVKVAESGAKQLPQKKIYVVSDDREPDAVQRSARKTALRQLIAQNTIVKQAIDPRLIDQRKTRNPRPALQHYHRSAPYVSQEVQGKIDIFSRLMPVLSDIKQAYGEEVAYHNSYIRELYGHVERALRIKYADNNFHEPQLAYLEQLLYARYRLSMEEIGRMTKDQLKTALLSKDEDLLRRGVYLAQTGPVQSKTSSLNKIDIKQSDNTKDAIAALFGNVTRNSGEKKVQRTITIKITDDVLK